MSLQQNVPTAARFDYVCLHCGRVHQQNLSVLVPGGSFRCPFCKSDFHVAGGKIRLKMHGGSARLKNASRDPGTVPLRTEPRQPVT